LLRQALLEGDEVDAGHGGISSTLVAATTSSSCTVGTGGRRSAGGQFRVSHRPRHGSLSGAACALHRSGLLLPWAQRGPSAPMAVGKRLGEEHASQQV
jgi:hypothetical protein